MKKILFALLLASGVLTNNNNALAAIVYVNHTATGFNTGTSWADAYTHLEAALATASSGDHIWVAAGTYYPTTTTDRTISFNIPSNVEVYGGFAGIEPANYNLDLRNFAINTTILSGDIDGNGQTTGGNSFNVVTITNKTGSIVLDGLKVILGNASWHTGSNRRGGGLYTSGIPSPNSLTIRNCEFKDNKADFEGGGAYFVTTEVSLINCLFEGNDGNVIGGGASFDPSSGSINTIKDCQFKSNIASQGAGIAASSKITIENSLLEGNTASYRGGAISLYPGSSNSIIEGCTIASNTGGDAVAVFANGSNNTRFYNCNFIDNVGSSHSIIYNHTCNGLDFINCSFSGNAYTGSNSTRASIISVYQSVSTSYLRNCILWGNTSLSNVEIHNNNGIHVETCIVEGGFVGTNQSNVLNQDPVWIDNALNLDQFSPALDAGNNTYYTSTSTIDIDGDPRTVNSTIDLGAQESATPPNIKYVDHSATGANNGDNWHDAFTDLQMALATANAGDHIWVAKGMYYPTNTPDRTISFDIPSDVEIYGGFAGNEPSNFNLDLRDFVTNSTTLSGDIDMNSQLTGGNSFNVVTVNSKTGNIVLDGLGVVLGTASSQPGSPQKGGGIHATNIQAPHSLEIRNCDIVMNTAHLYGGGVYASNVNLNVENTHFMECDASGGGLYVTSSTQTASVTDCHFNTNYGGEGAGIYASAELTMKNCLLEFNQTNYRGGAMALGPNSDGSIIEACTFNSNLGGDAPAVFAFQSHSTTFTNCHFTSNTSNTHSAIYNHSSNGLDFINCSFKDNDYNGSNSTRASVISVFQSVSTSYLRNSIFWGNTALSNVEIHNNNGIHVETCIVEGGYIGTNQSNVIASNPLWLNSNLDLDPSSPAINAGNNAYYTSASTTDIDGGSRVVNITIDLGAQEKPLTGLKTLETYSFDSPIEDGLGEKEPLIFYPNPAADFITVKGGNSNTQIVIYDMSGRVILSGLVGPRNQVDIRSLAPGAYVIKAQNNSTIPLIEKLIVE